MNSTGCCCPTTQLNFCCIQNLQENEEQLQQPERTLCPLVQEAPLWTDRFGCHPVGACLCRSKNRLNTKAERSTKTSFTMLPQADNHKHSERYARSKHGWRIRQYHIAQVSCPVQRTELLSCHCQSGDLLTSGNCPAQPCGHGASGTNCPRSRRVSKHSLSGTGDL